MHTEISNKIPTLIIVINTTPEAAFYTIQINSI
jgi:hypothetical protein